MEINFSINWGKSSKKKQEKPEPVEVIAESQSKRTEEQIIVDVLEKWAAENKDSFLTGVDNVTKGMPVVGGRSSVNEHTDGLVPGIHDVVNADFSFALLKTLENSTMFNRHISYAVENIVNSGSTDFSVEFPDNTDEESKRMLKELQNSWGGWYEFSDGINSLINDLLVQAATYGCISAEAVPHENLRDGIKKAVRVSPIYIRFSYDREEDMYIPLQALSFAFNTRINESKRFPGYIELNKATYFYSALRRVTTKPYAVPPFITALNDLVTEDGMVSDLRQMMKKLGMLGFLSVLLDVPKQNQGEGDSAYATRVLNHLELHRPQVEAGFSKGVTIGVKDSHEFQLQGQNLNVQGADGLMKIVNQLIFSGLKQDPNLHGHNYATTETFGRVILAKMQTQIKDYQRLVASFLERIFLLHLQLKGFPIKTISVVFEKAMVSDNKKDKEAEKIHIENVKTKYNMGIISQQQAALELGYDQPDEEEPRVLENSNSQNTDDGNTREDTAVESNLKKKSLKKLIKKIKVTDEFDYSIPDGESISLTTDFKDEFLTRNAKDYFNSLRSAFSDALKSFEDLAVADIEQLDGASNDKVLHDIMLGRLFSVWQNEFTAVVADEIDLRIENVYTHFRNDQSPFTDSPGFNKASFFEIPDAVFDTSDLRAIDYLKQLDNIYVSQFITDEDTRRRVKSWITEEYLAEGNPIGKDTESIRRFVQDFQDEVLLESWKIRRVIETTLNKARNYANAHYIKQAGLTHYEVVEILDSRTCPWCRHINGSEFSVNETITRIDGAVNTSPQNIGSAIPFATSIPIQEFRKMSSQEIFDAGITTPPYHPHCRGRIVAVI